MNDIAFEYSTVVQSLQPGNPPKSPIIMFSTVSTSQVSSRQLCQSDYWVKNMVSPVRFSETLALVCTQSVKSKRKRLGQPIPHQIATTDLVEIRPHSALKALIRETLQRVPKSGAIQYHSVLARYGSAMQVMLEIIGQLHCSGYPVNLLAAEWISGKSEICLTNLPEYPFNHSRRHWLESRTSKGYRFCKAGQIDLLGAPSTD